jgi:hypothetical protein
MANNYKDMMDRLLELPSCALFPLGRTGSDLLQSMLDSHPEVLTFNGALRMYDFLKTSMCVMAGSFDTMDLIDEFIGYHIKTLKSKYNLMERKNQLGDNYDQSIDIDVPKFRSEMGALLEGREATSRNFLLAVYGAYALCLGQDLSQKKIFFHHPHDFTELPAYLKDFPDSKIIGMTRDPRANFVSSIEHHRDFNELVDTDNSIHLIFQITRILNDGLILQPYGKDYRLIRIEDLGSTEILQALCHWLNISYDECMTRSTWAGMSWHSDRMSPMNREPGFSKAMLDNQWEKRLSFIDKYVLNYILNPRLKQYGYSYKQISPVSALIVAFLIPLPLSYELRFMSPSYIREHIQKKNRRSIPMNGLNYLRRIRLFLRFYLRVTKLRTSDQPILTAEPIPTPMEPAPAVAAPAREI